MNTLKQQQLERAKKLFGREYLLFEFIKYRCPSISACHYKKTQSLNKVFDVVLDLCEYGSDIYENFVKNRVKRKPKHSDKKLFENMDNLFNKNIDNVSYRPFDSEESKINYRAYLRRFGSLKEIKKAYQEYLDKSKTA